MNILKTVAAVLGLACALPSLAADEPGGWALSLGPGSALEAARRLFSGATQEADGSLVLAHDRLLRLPGTSKTRAQLPAGTRLSAPTALRVRSEGRPYTLLMWEGVRPDASGDGGFGEEVAVLAVLPEGSLDASDVAEVKGDRDTYLDQGPVLGSEDAFTVLNAHHNSSQGYASTDLFHLRDGRLRRIASVFTLSSLINCQDAFQEDLQWRVEPDGDGPPRILAQLTLTHAPALMRSGCDRMPRTRNEHFEDRYRWNAAQKRYLHEGGNSDRLDRWNDQHR